MAENSVYRITMEVTADSTEAAIEQVIEILNAGGEPDEILKQIPSAAGFYYEDVTNK